MVSIVEHVPLWVWPVLVLVLWRGIQSLGTRTVTVWVAGLVPLVFLVLSVSSVGEVAWGAPVIALVWVLALGLGVALGWWFLSAQPTAMDRGRGTVTIPGSPWLLVVLVAVFSVKFAYGYGMGTGAAWATEASWRSGLFGISGLSTGIVVGRTLRLYAWYFSGEAEAGD